jgi:hypothetical protein
VGGLDRASRRSGHHPEEAVAWVRAIYCAKAVQTGKQEALVAHFEPVIATES